MRREDVVLGMKVVPHKKTAKEHVFNSFKVSAQRLENSEVWNMARVRKQPFLYVAHQHADDKAYGTGRFLLNDKKGLPCGDYFMAEDFEPYEESTIEIERKFLLERFPDEEPIGEYNILQGYISTEPEVRLRSKEDLRSGKITYKLCFKGNGDLTRKEVEVDIDRDKYDSLVGMLTQPPITKNYKRYKLPGDLISECSVVDEGTADEWMYAEVEFSSETAALDFKPPAYFGKEVTYDSSYKMKNYWNRRNH